MTVRLLNAAVMPRPGRYELWPVTAAQFAELVRQHKPISYIGYPACAEFLRDLCGCDIPVNRESTPVDDGDHLLIAQLKYRVGNPVAKGQVQARLDDYEFFECVFSAHDSRPGCHPDSPTAD